MEFYKKHYLLVPPRPGRTVVERDHEIKALQLLEENFINTPKIDHYPFSKMISTESCATHPDCYTITMTHCGITAVENAKLVETQNNIQPINYYNTIECIINNLCNLRLIHLDLKGDNVLINTSGHVSLIDFGVYNFVNKEKAEEFYRKPNLKELKNDLYKYTRCTESDHFMVNALQRDRLDIYRRRPLWKQRIFKCNPWSMLHMF